MRKKLNLGTLRKLLIPCPDKGSLLHFLNLVGYIAPNQYPKYSFLEQETEVGIGEGTGDRGERKRAEQQ